MTTPYVSNYTGAEMDEGIRRAYLAEEQLQLTYTGVWDLEAGVSSGSVIGLALPFIPHGVQLTVSIPPGGVSITANPYWHTLTADGFDFKLSETTVGIRYRLHYTLTGEVGGDSSG